MDLTAFVIVVGGIVGLILGVWALVDLWRGPYSVVGKIGWTFGIIILPILMSVIYLASRPSSKMQQQAYEIEETTPEDITERYGHHGDL